MKIILLKPVADLGEKGDVVDVAEGYGRNYLLPRGLGVKASDGALKQAETMRLATVETARRSLEEARSLADTLAGTRVVVAARAGDAGNLFGSIGAADIAQAVVKFTGIDIDKGIIQVKDPIKEIGLHEIVLKPHAEVEVSITLDVIPA